jgi:excisionase family DNA binding protein
MKKERQLTKVDGAEFLTVEEAAKVLHVKPVAIRNYLYLGRLTTHKFKTLTLLNASEVNRWKDRQR